MTDEQIKEMLKTNWIGEGSFENPKDSYFSLWDKINGKDSHEQNPYVWVIEFEKLT
ncbi:MAG TPA: hypothetical protein PK079_22550 [Leptospiraceae bacterium]|nr:hypothetical protein [Leptospiraceae bacterium]HNA10420.1 hypothetical protein [Leptospiraceae bacterium]HNE55963.1 hypothetical protein [Leptospiraceae bacterium]HNF57479.1 hypothetical protein [Leptospiraceae bacterium]HNM92273.1 hypothetical protein [Leptospiraceae bacterium]